MLRTTNPQVKAKLVEHVLSYFTKDYGWDSDDTMANLKEQMKAFNWLPTDYAGGKYMAEGGTFLIYYREQRDFLGDLLEENEFEREHKYSDNQVFATYCHLVGRTVSDILKGAK